MNIRKIVLIGAGNVATHLAKAFLNHNLEILQVFSRTEKSAKTLALKINAQPISHLQDIVRDADLYIISVGDDAVSEIASNLQLGNSPVVHTSGTLPADVLSKVSTNFGVFYPLQTFSKEREIDFANIPVLIEASNPNLQSNLVDLGKLILANVRVCDSEKRKIIHLAAVFACNFSNFMFILSDEILRSNQLSFELLKPLILETAEKVIQKNPRETQTGPAIRKDLGVMAEHVKLLAGEPEKQKIYQLLSNQISMLFNTQNNGT